MLYFLLFSFTDQSAVIGADRVKDIVMTVLLSVFTFTDTKDRTFV